MTAMLELLELAEECPELDELRPYLADPDAEVRRQALSVLSETTEEWAEASPVIATALSDPDPAVAYAAIGFVNELREVLVPTPEFAAALRSSVGASDPAIRAAAIGALWRHRLTDAGELAGWLADPDVGVRRTTVAGLTSIDALGELDSAATDPDTLVRISVANGIGAVGDPRGAATLIGLARDLDFLVRAAALKSLAKTGFNGGATELAVAAIADPAWEVREAAAIALGVAQPEVAAAPLISAVHDDNFDVRKAAVRALGERVAARPDVVAALESAQSDPDADVRAYARIGLARKEPT